MKQLSIKLRLLLLGAIAMAILLAVGLVGFVGSRNLVAAMEQSNRIVGVLRNQTEADMMHDAIRADVLNLFRLMAQPSQSADEFKAVHADLADHLDNFNRLIGENDRAELPPPQRAALDALKPDLEAYVRQAKEVSAKFEARAADADQAFQAFAASFEKLEGSMEKFSELIERDAHAHGDAQAAATQREQAIVLAVIGIGAALLFGAVWWIAGSITGPLADIRDFLQRIGGDLTRKLPDYGRNEIGDTARSVNRMIEAQAHTIRLIRDAVGSVASVSDSLKARAGDTSQQADQASERAARIGAAAEELSVAVQDVSRNIQRTAERAHEAAATARDAQAAMARSQAAGERLTEATRQSAALIEQLGDAAGQIDSVAGTIREIADQTNLLALNAAIEAARAGSEGRGFAVVADEVRKLAERTAQSTASIARMTEQIGSVTASAARAMGEVTEGVRAGAGEVANAMVGQDAIVKGTGEMRELATEIADTTRGQAASVEETAIGMAEIGERIEAAAGAMRAIDAGVEQLLGVVNDLRQHVAHFQVGT
ncbi:methyl-accepting chemotaxis protein [Chitinimonas koreensis]|uniref:methyl-accepting chemotaxis protein n=1 Tax=Chitinimonas koreensis TaxID=356302 RepID=UPI0003FC9359|nr:methyl-accepting chemotaxis protein [Chitinimonas koreensis]QNM97300.1 methyl-accepting chemotaxis protein [Chitinimonas koreensis]